MRQIQFDMGKVYKLPHTQLKNYFEWQKSGNARLITTPFADSQGFWPSLEEWMSTLRAQLAGFPWLLEFEEEMAKKVGPLSIMQPVVERLPKIEEYYTLVGKQATPVMPEAITAVVRRWGGGQLLQLETSTEAIERMKLSTNSGSPYFTKRRVVLDADKVGVVSREGDRWYTTNPDGKFELMATLGWRGQEGGPNFEDVKQRVLWMFPMDLNIQEARLYNELVLNGQRTQLVPTWMGPDDVDARMTRLFSSKGADDYIVATDFTGFDQHFGSACEECAGQVYDGLFGNRTDYQQWRKEIFPAKWRIPLCYQWGKGYIGYHGMASGSGGTNADETTVHTCFQTEAAILANATLNPNSMCLGDDGVLSYPGINVDHVMRVYESHGQEMNASKQEVSRDSTTFLRRKYYKGYVLNGINRGVYATSRALGKLKYMERWHEDWDREAVIVRALSIIENCRFHPLREEFLTFCLERDAYRLGLDIPGFLDPNSFSARVMKSAAAGQLGYQYVDGFNPRPATSWWVYQALKARQ